MLFGVLSITFTTTDYLTAHSFKIYKSKSKLADGNDVCKYVNTLSIK